MSMEYAAYTFDFEYTFGFEMVLLVACWEHYRIPVALGVIDPQVKGHQNHLLRQMLQAFEPPRWARRVVVLGDAGFAATKTLAVIAEKGYYYVFWLFDILWYRKTAIFKQNRLKAAHCLG